MAENNNDVIMYMTLDTGQVKGEARSQLDSTDDMIDGSYYKPFQKGSFFELKTFSFGVSVKEGSREADKKNEKPGAADADKKKEREATKAALAAMQKASLLPEGPERQKALAAIKGPKEFEFKNFMMGGDITAYPVELATISYERIMDIGSSTIWNYFNEGKAVVDAVILKRKDDGWEGGPQGFFALYFKDLIITDIDWEGDDLIIEKGKMVCRYAQILYKTQQPDIYTGKVISTSWSYQDPS